MLLELASDAVDACQGKYPVLYLLHGIGGDETEWQRFANPDRLFDNLIADSKAVPMIVVMDLFVSFKDHEVWRALRDEENTLSKNADQTYWVFGTPLNEPKSDDPAR